MPFRDAPEWVADRSLDRNFVTPNPRWRRRGTQRVQPYRTLFPKRELPLIPRMLMVRGAQDNGTARRRPERALCREPEHNQGEGKPRKSLTGNRQPGRSGVLAAHAARQEHFALSGVPALRGRRPRDRDKGKVLDAEAAANRGFDGLHGWMKKAEKIWNAHQAFPDHEASPELFDYFCTAFRRNFPSRRCAWFTRLREQTPRPAF